MQFTKAKTKKIIIELDSISKEEPIPSYITLDRKEKKEIKGYEMELFNKRSAEDEIIKRICNKVNICVYQNDERLKPIKETPNWKNAIANIRKIMAYDHYNDNQTDWNN